MRLLLDTHAFLWWCANDPRLSTKVTAAVGDGDNEVYFSAVSGWEIAIKSRLGRLDLPEAPTEFVPRMLQLHAFGVLPITLRHALSDFQLPAVHPDPFDRLLVSQAQVEGLTLVTNDRAMGKYDVATFW
ncbi:MAG: type II toxin-antitoxin system VapC family toxin [Truepera sp.]|jgi:PIN domain nuclease of toxin-antitoxin system|nr:type II toxin-antitoxin system VapC family toxin [Truepera sp.]